MAEPERVFLHPAEVFIGGQPAYVRTVLGSCVAVTLRVPRLGLAAMSHCQLPSAGTGAYPGFPELLRYVDTAVEYMLTALARRGARHSELEVKLFGGADGIERNPAVPGYRVGRRNVEAALEALEARGMVPSAAGVGGRCGRVIEFNTATGEVLVRQLENRLLVAQDETVSRPDCR